MHPNIGGETVLRIGGTQDQHACQTAIPRWLSRYRLSRRLNQMSSASEERRIGTLARWQFQDGSRLSRYRLSRRFNPLSSASEEHWIGTLAKAPFNSIWQVRFHRFCSCSVLSLHIDHSSHQGLRVRLASDWNSAHFIQASELETSD